MQPATGPPTTSSPLPTLRASVGFCSAGCGNSSTEAYRSTRPGARPFSSTDGPGQGLSILHHPAVRLRLARTSRSLGKPDIPTTVDGRTVRFSPYRVGDPRGAHGDTEVVAVGEGVAIGALVRCPGRGPTA